VTKTYTEHHVVWHCSLLSSCEYASLIEGPDGTRLHGIVVAPQGDIPSHIDYEVVADHDWRPLEVTVRVTTPIAVRRIELERNPADSWRIDGRTAPQLDGCDQIDLGWTPSTNTLPIRRLDLGVGESASIIAAWVRFPELDIVANGQSYTRLANDRWRYRSGDYDFELVTDPISGIVLAYGEDLWRASAMSSASGLRRSTRKREDP